MRLGVHLVNFTPPGGRESLGSTLAAVGLAADEAGVDNLSLMDHYFQLEFLADAHDPMLEGYTALGFLAAHTSSVELQLLMTGVTYRHPGLLAKIVSTLDVLSGGRAALGIGAAMSERCSRPGRQVSMAFLMVANMRSRSWSPSQAMRSMSSAAGRGHFSVQPRPMDNVVPVPSGSKVYVHTPPALTVSTKRGRERDSGRHRQRHCEHDDAHEPRRRRTIGTGQRDPHHQYPGEQAEQPPDPATTPRAPILRDAPILAGSVTAHAPKRSRRRCDAAL